jgi:hypothetical protein
MANDLIARQRFIIQEQMKEIDRLRAKIDRLQVAAAQRADAMACLMEIYTDPSIKPEIRAKAAQAVLPFQRPKLTVAVRTDAAVLTRVLRDAELEDQKAKTIEHDPQPAA